MHCSIETKKNLVMRFGNKPSPLLQKGRRQETWASAARPRIPHLPALYCSCRTKDLTPVKR